MMRRRYSNIIHCPLGRLFMCVLFPLFASNQTQLYHPARLLNFCLVDRSRPHTETDLQTSISKSCSCSVQTNLIAAAVGTPHRRLLNVLHFCELLALHKKCSLFFLSHCC